MSREYVLQPFQPAVDLQIDYAAELNEQQHAAVTAPPGPSLVIAGAGSGKTRTLTYRVAFLLEQGIPPDRILLLTFTNKAAKEMMLRVTDLLGQKMEALWGGTFHSIGNRVLRRYAVSAAFLAPALVLLGVWIVYPAVYTIVRSFYGQSGFGDFVGIDNYKTMFSTGTITTAIKNNAIWVGVVPATITAIGLVFAVLTEKINWSLAFKTAVFMPMAISLFAAGVIWRIMDRQEPQLGTVNAFVQVFHDMFHPPGALSDAVPRQSNVAEPGPMIFKNARLSMGAAGDREFSRFLVREETVREFVAALGAG